MVGARLERPGKLDRLGRLVEDGSLRIADREEACGVSLLLAL
jgi:hypothetical protein